MKITQEVREFAAKQNDRAQDAGGMPSADHPLENSIAVEEAEKGMREMSERFREGGNELYVGAGGREHD